MVRSQAPDDLTIGKLAAAGNVGVETVRFYQRRGLLATPRRLDGIRRYGPADVSRLRFIRQAQAAGFTLEEIRQLLALDSGEDRAAVRLLATKRLAELEARMAELQEARLSLQRLVSECAVGKTGPCPILKSFKA
ncbi:MerR family DNA-binding protein [Shinella yambaruensis]|uniref:Mercuric resistance operon regulatory protein n=1 Tax=Shinella yambaruensis TaxID=415996 RepID=A0ABQ5ZQM7_9HYPH|nr:MULTISPECIES: MerR family DNA-binding protein [Shinella]CAI0335247.1 Mercuric resistance operon regulatory protein [Rhizobiaceae bacterium]CAK7259556.1 Mercuric resistance operon regulatory protein [Shinella sp. WSC3-e]MCJ8025070.1 MerR family DNA-binding protein [Shinella yambaruensis]MCO5137885.1 MerR family DNA-binding protein [Shinella sp.]MCU7979523.1 MerR family DNA-binding protein [Shinella yambaruensis]